MSEIKRQTAYKCSLKQIKTANYVQTSGWDPNFLEIGGFKVSRTNNIAVIISKDENKFVIEDGTDSIEVRVFNELKTLKDLKPGMLVLVIARPRKYSNMLYLVPEIVKPISNKKWLQYRLKELELIDFKAPVEQVIEMKESKEQKMSPHQILDMIKELDKGEGVPFEELIEKINADDAEKSIQNLINEGEIFEIRPGKLKILDLS